jgi:hypothetical protein
VSAPRASDDEIRELLDAYLDGELDVGERAQVDELLSRSDTARAELDEIDRVRTLVRGLPPVEPPFGFFERMARRRRRAPGVTVAAIGAAAAAIVLVVAISPVADRLAPPVEDLGTRHAMLASSASEMPDGYTSIDTEAMQDMADPFDAPATAGEYQRMHAYDTPDGVHVLYAKGGTMVSVFEQSGEVDWSGLPAGGTRMTMDGDDAWAATQVSGTGAAATDIVVLARDGLIVTVLGVAPHDDVVAIAEAVPDPPEPSMVERVGDTCAWVAEGFGFPD